jgi:hypothetical protein
LVYVHVAYLVEKHELQSRLSIKQTAFLPQASFVYFPRRLFENQGLDLANRDLLSLLQGAKGGIDLKMF